MGNNKSVVLVDLCQAPDDEIALILKRVPAKELLKACTLVSKQWHRILSAKFFWREKLEADGCRLPRQRLAELSVNSYKLMAVKQPFMRNFLRDSWDLTRRDKDCFQMDGRWRKNSKIVWNKDGKGDWYDRVRIEVPPTFSTAGQQPEMGPELGGEPVLACVATTSNSLFNKRIVIRLADEGLTDELMDSYRPTIVVSELVANHRSENAAYEMNCFLSGTSEGGSPWVGRRLNESFQQGEAESWRLVRHEFKQYPAGMRYLRLECGCYVRDFLRSTRFKGVKLARCSVMALCEREVPVNVREEEEHNSWWEILPSPTWSNFLIPVALSVGVFIFYKAGTGLLKRA